MIADVFDDGGFVHDPSARGIGGQSLVDFLFRIDRVASFCEAFREAGARDGIGGVQMQFAAASIARISFAEGDGHEAHATATRRAFLGLVPIIMVMLGYGEVFMSEAKAAAGAPVPPILPPQDGFLFLDRAKFRASFAADVSPELASFMADSQVPWGVAALDGAVTEPAWRSKPSWYLVSTDDKMIPPDAQRAMSKRAGATVVEVQGSHSVYVSQPKAVASLIAKAASGVAVATR